MDTVRVELTGAFPQDCISRLAAEGIPFWNLERRDELTVRVTLRRRDLPRAQVAARRTMCSLELQSAAGAPVTMRRMGLRAVYPLVLAAVVAFSLWTQGHIWFLDVLGNSRVPAEQILQALESLGVGFWTDPDDIDAQALKNRMLEELPDLGWLSVNVEGVRAHVLVRERSEKPVIQEDAAPADIAARKAGLVTQVEVTGGTAAVHTGQVVLAGQVLISGLTDLETTAVATRAAGEVYARTWTPVAAVAVDTRMEKAYTGEETTGYFLTIGKKTLNFCKSGGISYPTYDKMIEMTSLTLPGGFALPVSLTKVTYRAYTPRETRVQESEAAALLAHSAETQLMQTLVAGQILSKTWRTQAEDGLFRLLGTVECQEEIGTPVDLRAQP